MNEYFTSPPPPPPDDEAHDPLLRALHQQLGEGFGQEPPPGLWAGIREQLPVAQPWWRRRRYLLPLLALLLLSTGALWQAGRLHRAGLLAGRVAPSHPAAGKRRQAASSPSAATAGPAASWRPGGEAITGSTATGPSGAQANTAANYSPVAAAPAMAPGSYPTAPTTVAGPGAIARQVRARAAATSLAARAKTAPSLRLRAGGEASSGAAANTRLSIGAEPLGAARQRRGQHGVRLATLPLGAAINSSRVPQAAGVPRRSRQLTAANALPVDSPLSSQAHRAKQTRVGDGRRLPLALGQQLGSRRLPGLGAGGQRLPDRARRPSAGLVDSAALAAAPTGALVLLGGRGTGVQVPRLELPAPLAATNVPGPWLTPGRRWAVQVTVGPSLSYRTVQTGQTLYSRVGYIDSITAGLERPALGWGAQVQLRRVLAGRWALGLGLGYQEYATRLNLDVVTYSPNPTSAIVLNTTTAVRQRDTYRLLTVPVQLSYLLGPRGPWQLGVLGGAEPGLYLGGRTTENSGCNCQQQTFTSAAGSPYNTLSLALSLGLDVRLRLGGPASRWWLLAQPTGRYVATPFVRSEYAYYAQRQPYSLGLLLGAAWEW